MTTVVSMHGLDLSFMYAKPKPAKRKRRKKR